MADESDWETVAVGPPATDDSGDWETVAVGPKVVDVYREPTLGESAKYVGQSFLEGGRNLLSLLSDYNPATMGQTITARAMGEKTQGEKANELLRGLGVGAPDEKIVGAAPRMARTVMNFEAAPGGPISNALAGIGAQIGKESDMGPLGQFALAAALGSAPATLEALPARIQKTAEAFDRTALGVTRAPKSRFVRGSNEAQVDTAARELIGEGVFPGIKTPSGNQAALNQAFEEAGKRYEKFGTAADNAGMKPPVPTTNNTDAYISSAAPSEQQHLTDWFNNWRISFADKWDGTFSSLGKEITNLGDRAYAALKDRLPRNSIQGLANAIREDLTAARDIGLNAGLGAGTSEELGQLNRLYTNLSRIEPTIQSAANRSNHMNVGQELGRMLWRFAWPEATGWLAGLPGLGTALGVMNNVVRNPTGAGVIGSLLRGGNRPLGALGRALESVGEVAPLGLATQSFDENSDVLQGGGNRKTDADPNERISSNLDHFSLIPSAQAEELSLDNTISPSAETEERVREMPVSELLLDGLRQVESGGGKHLVSDAGALGPYQFLPGTFKQWGEEGKSPMEEEPARKAARNYLDYLLKKFDNNIELALTAYHSGEGRVERLLKETKGKTLKDIKPKLGPRGQEYADKVLHEVGKLSSLV